MFQSCNSDSILITLPDEILLNIGDYLSFQDLNNIALAGRLGKIWADNVMDFFAKELLCLGETMEERKCNLIKLYQETSFIGSIYNDIDKLKDKTFENGSLTIEFGEESYTPFFLINFASGMLDQTPGCKEIAREYEEIVTYEKGWSRLSMIEYYYPPQAKRSGIIGIKVRQTPSNNVFNVVSIKLLDALKKASQVFFVKLFENIKIPDLNIEKKLPEMERFEKYKNKFALVIHKKENYKLRNCHCVIGKLLSLSGLIDKVDFIYYYSFIGVYGEKEDVQKLYEFISSQCFPAGQPLKYILRQAHKLNTL